MENNLKIREIEPEFFQKCKLIFGDFNSLLEFFDSLTLRKLFSFPADVMMGSFD